MKTMLMQARGLLLCSVVMVLTNDCDAQTSPKLPKDTSFPMTTTEIKRIANRQFGSLVSTNTSNGQLGNFASIDPVGTSFKFQGTASLNRSDTSKKNPCVSFLSFSAKGDLFGQNIGTLFSNSSLNTGISINASYHLMLARPRTRLSWNEASVYKVNKVMAERQFFRTVDQLDEADSMVVVRKLALVDREIGLVRTAVARVKALRVVTAIVVSIPKPIIRDAMAKALIDAAGNNETELAANQKKLTALSVLRDSLLVAETKSMFLASHAQWKAEKAKNTIVDSLLNAFPVAKYSFVWATFSGGGGKQNYTTYDAAAPFDNQIQKADYNTYQLGLSINFFKKNALNNVIHYHNLGFSRQRTNNIDLLSTKAITDTRKVLNSAGDVTRVTEKKYNAYTDPIIEDEGWKFFLNSYVMFGKKPSGLHFFPDINFQDNNTTILNMSLGFIVSFVNQKKDQPVINTEVYFKLKDMTDQGGAGVSGVWNRNELGISFILPFNLLTK